MNYVDLLRNPEDTRATTASKLIEFGVHHEENFKTSQEIKPKEQLLLAWRSEEPKHSGQCLERRVFYKLISGLQASISTRHAVSPFTFWEVVRERAGIIAKKVAGVDRRDRRALLEG